MEASNKIYTGTHNYPLSRIEQLSSDLLSLIFKEISLQKIKELFCTPRFKDLLKTRCFKILIMQKLKKTQQYHGKEVYGFWEKGVIFRKFETMHNCYRKDLASKSKENTTEISAPAAFSTRNIYLFKKRVIFLTYSGKSFGVDLKTLKRSFLDLHKEPERGYFITAQQQKKGLLAVTDWSTNARIQVIKHSNRFCADFDISEPNTEVRCERLLFIGTKILGLFRSGSFDTYFSHIETIFIKLFSVDQNRLENKRELSDKSVEITGISANSEVIVWGWSGKIRLIDPTTLQDKIIIDIQSLYLRTIDKSFLIFADKDRFYIYDFKGIFIQDYAGKCLASDDSFVLSEICNKIQIWDLLTGKMVSEFDKSYTQTEHFKFSGTVHFKAGRYLVFNEDIYHLKDFQG